VTVAPKDPPPAVPAASTSAEPTETERLKKLVPERIGVWKLKSLVGPLPGREDPPSPSVDAEFRHGERRAAVSVSDAGVNAAARYTGAPVRETTDEGREATYREGNATVLERLRKIDRQAQVTLLRDDGIVVIAKGTGIDTAQLKKLVLGIKARSAMAVAR
jgi:hypothetical protein